MQTQYAAENREEYNKIEQNQRMLFQSEQNKEVRGSHKTLCKIRANIKIDLIRWWLKIE